jgi:hypothetical protein
MARERGLNPNWQQNVQTSDYHPVLSAAIFGSKTETGGGSTMDVNTGAFVNPDDSSADTYLVGKEPDKNGNPIPTTPVANHADLFNKFPGMVRSIRETTGGRPGASIGSWKNNDGSIDVDASASEPNLSKALGKAETRNEQAIWSTKKFRKAKQAYAAKHGIPYAQVEQHARDNDAYLDGDIPNPHYKETK